MSASHKSHSKNLNQNCWSIIKQNDKLVSNGTRLELAFRTGADSLSRSEKSFSEWSWTNQVLPSIFQDLFLWKVSLSTSFNNKFDLLSLIAENEKRGYVNSWRWQMRNRIDRRDRKIQGIGSNDSNPKYASWLLEGNLRSSIKNRLLLINQLLRAISTDITRAKIPANQKPSTIKELNSSCLGNYIVHVDYEWEGVAGLEK